MGFLKARASVFLQAGCVQNYTNDMAQALMFHVKHLNGWAEESFASLENALGLTEGLIPCQLTLHPSTSTLTAPFQGGLSLKWFVFLKGTPWANIVARDSSD
ncbi:MAG: hypothetical protein ACLR5S_10750 [Ruminococcus sp.]